MWLYNILIRLYGLAIWVSSFFLPKAKKLTRAYKTWEKNLVGSIIPGYEYVWFHASSLGELEDGRSVLEELKDKYPRYEYVLTFFSSTGFEQKKDSQVA